MFVFKDWFDEFVELCDEYFLVEEVEYFIIKVFIVFSSIGVERKELFSIELVDDDGIDVVFKDVFCLF